MTPTALPALDDHPIRMRHDGRGALVVDPVDAAPAAGALGRLSLRFARILVTHCGPEHADNTASHSGRTVYAAVRSWKDHYR